MTGLDYEFRQRTEVADAVELEQVFHDREDESFRIVGSGSEQWCLPTPPANAVVLSLAKLDKIERLETQDLTCSVQPGVLRSELDEELERRGLCLPCAGGGTVGGLFAADPIGSLAPGAHSPRSLLLGLEGILPEGLCFRSGARVVKSVAGFDLQKLFVGSRGRLFAVTLLHLKLRPKPAARSRFRTEAMDREPALDLFSRLRLRSAPPASMVLSGSRGSFRVQGEFEGAAALVRDSLQQFDLTEGDEELLLRVKVVEGMEGLHGRVRPSRIPGLLDTLGGEAEVLITGGSWFEAAVPMTVTDRALGELARIGASAEVNRAGPARRGRGTAMDPKAASLMQAIKMALDPGGVLV